MRMRRTGIYSAAGASVVAAAFTARYVAKWRRRRTMRSGGERGGANGPCFIGLDLSDPTARSPRPCDYAVMDEDLVCAFGQWEYRENGARIIPDQAIGRSFILAVDGPQGLAGMPDAKVRQSERLVRAPGRTPYALQEPGSGPYAGLIAGSVRLFAALTASGSRFRLLGLNGTPASDATLIEAYPGGAWKALAGGASLPAKRTAEGRRVRAEMLETLGVQLPPDVAPTDDQLDAAIAAWTAHQLWIGEADAVGDPPSLDDEGVIREGYVVMPSPPPPDEAESGPPQD